MAKLTDGFSFAYLQEAFVATLLVLARGSEPDLEEEPSEGSGDEELDSYEIYRVFKAQVKILRDEMGSSGSIRSHMCTTVNAGELQGVDAVDDLLSRKMMGASLDVDEQRGMRARDTTLTRHDGDSVGVSSIVGSDRLTADNAWRGLGKASRFADTAFEWGTTA